MGWSSLNWSMISEIVYPFCYKTSEDLGGDGACLRWISEFKGSLVYKVSSRTAKARLHRETLSQINRQTDKSEEI